MSNERRWVIWYLHWRHHHSMVDIKLKPTKEDAFRYASYLEDEAEDCVNEVIGIEDPDGNYIDLAEYHAAKPELARKRDEYWESVRKEEDDAAQTQLTVTGPDGHKYIETWTDKYIEKYRQRLLTQFGTDRVGIERIGAPKDGQPGSVADEKKARRTASADKGE